MIKHFALFALALVVQYSKAVPVQDTHQIYKNLTFKCSPQRCSIYCPNIVIFPSNYETGKPSTIVGAGTTSSALNKSTTIASKSTNQGERFFYRKRKQHRKKSMRSTTEKARLHHLEAKKYTLHKLSPRQKHLLLKKLHSGNLRGKKGYEFKQMAYSYCRVVCQEAGQPNIPSPEKESTESDNSQEDSYEEGEDTPIEATMKPAFPENTAINDIRPFGGVDFNGWDDFGPSGDLASDVPEFRKKLKLV